MPDENLGAEGEGRGLPRPGIVAGQPTGLILRRSRSGGVGERRVVLPLEAREQAR